MFQQQDKGFDTLSAPSPFLLLTQNKLIAGLTKLTGVSLLSHKMTNEK